MKLGKFCFLTAACVISFSLYSYGAAAQIFLRDSGGGNNSSSSSSSGSSIFNFFGGGDSDDKDSKSAKNKGAGSGAFLKEKEQPDYSNYYQDKYRHKRESLTAREQANTKGPQAGVTYSIQEYNRLLQNQRSGGGNKASNTSRGRDKSKLVKTNPFTGRYSTQAEIEEMVSKREAYYAKYPDLPRKKRSLAEEIFFNKKGYYKSDASNKSSSNQSSARSDFAGSGYNGNTKIMRSDKRSTSGIYKQRAERYYNYEDNEPDK